MQGHSQPISHNSRDSGNSAINELLTTAQRKCNDPTMGIVTEAMKIWMDIIHISFNFPFKLKLKAGTHIIHSTQDFAIFIMTYTI